MFCRKTLQNKNPEDSGDLLRAQLGEPAKRMTEERRRLLCKGELARCQINVGAQEKEKWKEAKEGGGKLQGTIKRLEY